MVQKTIKPKGKLSCSSCGTLLNPKPKIKTPSGFLCIDCWCSDVGNFIEEHPLCD